MYNHVQGYKKEIGIYSTCSKMSQNRKFKIILRICKCIIVQHEEINVLIKKIIDEIPGYTEGYQNILLQWKYGTKFHTYVPYKELKIFGF